MNTPQQYRGPERRQNLVFVTRNTEYFVHSGRCLAVRDRRTESWLDGHLAVGRNLSGGVRVLDNGEAVPAPESPRVGDALYFSGDSHELITSVLCSVERAPREFVEQVVF